jgi:hypothetical protein
MFIVRRSIMAAERRDSLGTRPDWLTVLVQVCNVVRRVPERVISRLSLTMSVGSQDRTRLIARSRAVVEQYGLRAQFVIGKYRSLTVRLRRPGRVLGAVMQMRDMRTNGKATASVDSQTESERAASQHAHRHDGGAA